MSDWHRYTPLIFGATVPFVATALVDLATSGHRTLAIWLTAASLLLARYSGFAQVIANRRARERV